MGTLRDRFISLAERVTTPLLPADYLDIIDPAAVRRGPARPDRGDPSRDPRRRHPGDQAGPRLARPTPGQYIRIGVDVDGVRQWRAYSLTSETDRPDGWIAITVKAIPDGKVSNHLVRRATVGTIVQLDQAAGEFILPAATPRKILFLTAGSGITPVMGMLRNLPATHRAMWWSCTAPPPPTTSIFAGELRALARAGPNPPDRAAHRHRRHARRRRARRTGRRPRRARDLGLRTDRPARRARARTGTTTGCPSACTPNGSARPS